MNWTYETVTKPRNKIESDVHYFVSTLDVEYYIVDSVIESFLNDRYATSTGLKQKAALRIRVVNDWLGVITIYAHRDNCHNNFQDGIIVDSSEDIVLIEIRHKSIPKLKTQSFTQLTLF